MVGRLVARSGSGVFDADFASVSWRRLSRAFTEALSARPHAIVRGVDGDLHVVRVRLPQARAADPNEAGLRAQILDARGADVLHPGAESADELVNEGLERADGADLPLDTLRDDLRELADLAL